MKYYRIKFTAGHRVGTYYSTAEEFNGVSRSECDDFAIKSEAVALMWDMRRRGVECKLVSFRGRA